MNGVAELLAAETDAAPVQRVRNYHLTDREAVPRAEDFLTAMKRVGGALCVRWAGPPGECFVRYADPAWERAEHDRFRGRTTVETVDADSVRRWLRNGRPELIAYDGVRASFEADAAREVADSCSPRAAASIATDGGESSEARRASPERSSDGGRAATETVHVRRRADLRCDSALDRVDAEAVEAALPAGADERVFWLPLALAEETVLAPTARSDRVFVAEVVPERETDHAYYARQGRRSGWIPKGEARVYELADCALGEEVEDRRESA